MRTTSCSDPIAWHATGIAEALLAIQADSSAGLSAGEAARRRARFGANTLPATRRRSLLAVFFGQFKSPLIYLLFGVAAVALGLGHRSDAAVISIVVLLNAFIGAFQEGRAERSLEGLRRLTAHQARVIRDSREQLVVAEQLVPGDVLLVEAGDVVVADARLLDAAALQVAEAALTGESLPATKVSSPLPSDTPLADRANMLYAGTHLTAGRGRAVVIATGGATEIGHLAALAAAMKEPKTPLERRVAEFGRYIIFAALAMFVVVVIAGLARGLPFSEIALVGVSQVVGMIPEGLPVAMTVALAVGVQRMARRRAIIRRLSAVETLGSTTIICTDKTGTLTRNEMTVTSVALADGRTLSVTGAGYAPEGTFLEAGQELDPAVDTGLQSLLDAVVLCNDAQLLEPDESAPQWRPLGDPTEVALLTLARKGGVAPASLRARYPRRAELPFDADDRMMATQHETATGVTTVIKGAPEAVLDLCRYARRHGRDDVLLQSAREALLAAADSMATQALRVLAVAIVEGAEVDGRARFAAFRGRASLLGLVGQLDPPRPEVKVAVENCRAAGIRPVMVTGDHKATGLAVARMLGIARPGDAAVDGRELEQMSGTELEQRVDSISVFARVHPAQKLQIVKAYQRRGEVVAMTGDGVNDAPALASADVGVAMGITGTEVAKEAAKMVVADDNFATIVAAVEEGRVVYGNVKKVVLYLFSTSVAEVAVLLIAVILGYPPPLAAVQILWINLVTEGTVTVNLVMEPAEGHEMRQMPTPSGEALLSRTLLTRMAFMTPAIAVSTLGWFIIRDAQAVPFAQVQTETFTVLAVCQWFNVLNCRSASRSAFSFDLLKNPWLIGGLCAGNLLHAGVVFLPPLNRVFHTVPFSLTEVFAIGAVASLVLWVEELRKLVVRRRSSASGTGSNGFTASGAGVA